LVVCNLASINVAKVYDEKTIKAVLPVVMRALDNVITLNYYPIKEAERTSKRYRSVGLGFLGLAEYLAVNHLKYDSKKARDAVDKLFERYAFHTYKASCEIAKERGPYELFKGSELSKGIVLGRKAAWYEKNTKYGKDPDIRALADIANQIVAVDPSNLEDLSEEVAHVAIEMYSDQNSIISVLASVHNTPEYAEFYDQYGRHWL